MATKKKKDIKVLVMNKKEAERLLERKLTKEERSDLPDFMDYIDDRFWDDAEEYFRKALKEWAAPDEEVVPEYKSGELKIRRR